MNVTRLLPLTLVVAAVVSGCAPLVPPLEPIERKQREAEQLPTGIIRLPLHEVIAKYAPADFQANPNADIDFARLVRFDTSLPWTLAFEAALADASVDSSAILAVAEPPSERPRPAAHSPAPPAANAPDTTAARPAVIPDAGAQPSVLANTATPCGADLDQGAHVGLWEAHPNTSLKQTVERWSKSAGWALSWALKDDQTGELVDLTLGAGTRCHGTFRDALNGLFNALPAHVKVQVDLWGGNAPPLVHVSSGVEAQ